MHIRKICLISYISKRYHSKQILEIEFHYTLKQHCLVQNRFFKFKIILYIDSIEIDNL